MIARHIQNVSAAICLGSFIALQTGAPSWAAVPVILAIGFLAFAISKQVNR